VSKKYKPGLWIDLTEFDVEKIKRILYSKSGVFTTAFPFGTIPQGGSRLALITLDVGYVDHIGIVSDVHRASDMERKFQIGPVYHLKSPVPSKKLVSLLPQHLRRFVKIPTGRVETIPQKTWETILRNVIAFGQLDEAQLNRLQEVMYARGNRSSTEIPEAVAFERDAFATAFEMLGGTLARKAYICSSAAQSDAPFIKSLEHRDIQVIEDSMIQHDIVAFPGITKLVPSLVGAVKIFTHSGTLTVLNANRTKIERTLGVDLLYYNHNYRAFTFVQYKRMMGEKPVYRPGLDPNLEDEVRRMDDFEASSAPLTDSYEHYRLISCPFFLKLCPANVSSDWNGRMLPGMYFPLRLWKLLIASGQAKGPRGGLAVGYDQAPRRFNNSDFTRLLKQGWLGSSDCNTDRINKLLERSLSSGRSIIAASHQPDVKRIDYFRDDLGRFAEEDDESAI